MRRLIRVLFYAAILILVVTGSIFADRSSLPTDRTTRALQALGTDKRAAAEKAVDSLYGDINQDIAEIIDILSMGPESNSLLWGTLKGVSDALIPVGFTIASAFILLSFLNKSMMFQFRSYEDVAKVLLYMMLAKVILESSFELMGFIYSASASLISTAAVTPATIMNDVDKAVLVNKIMEMNFLDKLMFNIQQVPYTVTMTLIKVLIKVIAYGRLIEIYVYTSIAAIPLATLASPDHHQIAKKFIQGYIGVCLQGLIMMLSCVIFSAISTDFVLDQDNGNMLVMSVVLLFVLARSGSWGKQVAGLI